MFKFSVRSMQPYMEEPSDLGGGIPTPTDPTPTDPTPTDPLVDPTPADPTPPQDGVQTIKVKFNHEEKEIPYEEAVQLAQKGMNYDKAVERARQEAKDNWIAEQGYEWNGKPITTEAEYKTAVQEKQLLEQYKELPAEVAQKLTKVDTLEQRLSAYEQKELLSQQEQSLSSKPFYSEWKDEVKSMANQFDCDYETAYTMTAAQKMPEIIASFETKLKSAKDDAVKEYLAAKTKPQGTIEGAGQTPVISAQAPKSFAEAKKQSLEMLQLQFKKE
jgi:hypothetical protein